MSFTCYRPGRCKIIPCWEGKFILAPLYYGRSSPLYPVVRRWYVKSFMFNLSFSTPTPHFESFNVASFGKKNGLTIIGKILFATLWLWSRLDRKNNCNVLSIMLCKTFEAASFAELNKDLEHLLLGRWGATIEATRGAALIVDISWTCYGPI